MSSRLRGEGRRRARGFTLIEVLTVLALLGILTAMAAPSLVGFVQQSKRRAALDRVATDIAYAKLLAVRTGRRVELRFTGGGPAGCGLPSGFASFSGYRLVVRQEPERLVRQVDLAGEVGALCLMSNNVLAGQVQPLAFTSRGLAAGVSPRRIRAVTGERADSLRISTIGRVLPSY